MTEIKNPYGVAGLMGNLYAESALSPINLQGTYEKKLGYTDASYTAAVDNGSYTNFVKDSAGYGLAQWTYWSRKQNLLNFAKQKGVSIGDLDMQLAFLIKELKSYSGVWKAIINATSVKEASTKVLTGYEKPANQSDTVKTKRASYGQKYYDAYATSSVTKPEEPKEEQKKEDTSVAIDFNKYINSTGTHYISNSGSDENKNYHGGSAGDQTGHEWELRKWYNRPWTHVFRWVGSDTRVPRTLAELGIKAALNNKIGYDQYQRATYWTQLQKVGYDPSKIETACEEDCSAGVAANVKACGFLLGIKALQNVSSSMTSRNTVDQLKKAGFQVLTESKYLSSGKYLQPGDILLYANHHVAMNITKGANAAQVPAGYFSGASTAPSTDNEPVKERVSPYAGKGIGTAVSLHTMNVRDSYTTSANKLATIPRNTTVEVLAILENGWYKIVWNASGNGYAYVSNRGNQYFEYTPKAETAIDVPETPAREPACVKNPRYGATEVPEKNDETVKGEYKITASQAINIRKGPGTNFDVLKAADKKLVFKCDGSYTDVGATRWLYGTVNIKSIIVEGFASSRYLKKKA